VVWKVATLIFNDNGDDDADDDDDDDDDLGAIRSVQGGT